MFIILCEEVNTPSLPKPKTGIFFFMQHLLFSDLHIDLWYIWGLGWWTSQFSFLQFNLNLIKSTTTDELGSCRVFFNVYSTQPIAVPEKFGHCASYWNCSEFTLLLWTLKPTKFSNSEPHKYSPTIQINYNALLQKDKLPRKIQM